MTAILDLLDRVAAGPAEKSTVLCVLSMLHEPASSNSAATITSSTLAVPRARPPERSLPVMRSPA